MRKINYFIIVILFNFHHIFCDHLRDRKFVFKIHPHAGFFAVFLGVLNKLVWVKKNNKIPVVYSTKECLYYQTNGYMGANNMWEYYFKPVSTLKYNKGDNIYSSFAAPDGFRIAGSYSE